MGEFCKYYPLDLGRRERLESTLKYELQHFHKNNPGRVAKSSKSANGSASKASVSSANKNNRSPVEELKLKDGSHNLAAP